MKKIGRKHAKAWHAKTRVFRSIAEEITDGISAEKVTVKQVRRVAEGKETTYSHPVIARIIGALKTAGLYKPKKHHGASY